MSNVIVRESHNKPPSEIRKGITAFEEMLSKYMVKVSWSGDHATLSGPVSGSINISDDSIEVKVKLGMMAKMAGIDAKKLEGSIRKRLRAALDVSSE